MPEILPRINARYVQYYAPFVNKMKKRESGGRNTDSKGRLIKASTSSAAGIYQITKGTWALIQRQVGRTLDRFNLDDNESAMHQLFNNYCTALGNAKLPVNNTTLYSIHFTGSATFMTAAIRNPNASVYSGALSQAALDANKFLGRLGTLGAVVNNFAKSVNGPTITQLSNVPYTGKSNGFTYSGQNAEMEINYESPPPPPDKTIVNNKDQTIEEFITANNILMTQDEFMKYLTNSKTIFNSYNQEQKKQYKTASPELITLGTKVLVPMYQIASSKSIYTINQTIIENTKYQAFVEKEIAKLLNNPDYKRVDMIDSEMSREYGNLHKRLNNVSVWIWSKATDYSKGSHLIDITPFIIDLNTNVGDNGGNFSFMLPSITYESLKETNEYGQDFKFPMDWYTSSEFESFIAKNSFHKTVDFNSEKIFCDNKDDNNELKNNSRLLRRNPSFFHTLLQKNDLVFIRFERLKADRVYSGFVDGEMRNIPNTDLPENVFDMIGMIDSVTNISNVLQSDQTVYVSGRDLSKLLIDDSIYNFIVGYGVQSREQIIQSSNPDKSTGRNVIDVGQQQFNVGGGIAQDLEFNFFQTHSIDEWITFIFSQLTNTIVANSNLFSAYKNRSMITSRQNSINSNGDFTYKETLADGVWQIVKLCFDADTVKRRLADDSLSTNTGSLINMVRKFAQKPFIDINMDTYGDKYYFMFRKPPFTFESFKTNPCINIFESDIVQDSFDFETEVYSMYQLDALGSLIQTSNGENLLTIPAVLLEEFMHIYGQRNLNVASNYLDFDASVSNLTQSNIQHLIDQLNNDMEWLIQTNVYLPFTRRGTIVLKGDRRIKRGMNIRHTGTGEVYYVDNVSNYASFTEDNVERSTTLQVSRGMVEKDLDKYFNLVKREAVADKFNWRVNQEVFKYLLERRQFR